MDRETWKKAWALLDGRERRNAGITLAIVILGALTSALMVGSVLPFLSVLAEPRRIENVEVLAWAYNTFGFESDYGFLVGLGLTALCVIILSGGMQVLKTWAVARFSMMRMHTISHRLMAAYLCQNYEFFLNMHSGPMSTRILSETQQLVNQFLRPAAEAISSIFTIIAVVGLLLWIEPIVAIVAFTMVGSVYGIIYWFSKRALKGLGLIRVKANSSRFQIVNEALTGVKDIKLLGRERAYVERFETPSRDMAVAMTTIEVVSLVPKFGLEAIAFGGIIVLCLAQIDPQGLASGEALGGILPVLGMFAFAGQRLMPELQKVYQSLAQIQAGSASVEIIHNDLVNWEKNKVMPRSIPIGPGLTKNLVLENIYYQYPNADSVGIIDISINIQAGERVGIVGSTGSGKTTLADLILGLLSPREGRVVVDGTAVTDDNLRAWQQSVGYVPQDIFLTDASISENIALGVPSAEIKEASVRRAAEIARIDSFICEDLPDGYATSIGERGVRLSGGQRQRNGIARALYHDADLIVFDEATSALDNLTEREVMAAIDALPGHKTVLMIAHRLSTVKRCDRIIVLDKGRLVGSGTWDALMADNAAFRKIASLEDAT